MLDNRASHLATAVFQCSQHVNCQSELCVSCMQHPRLKKQLGSGKDFASLRNVVSCLAEVIADEPSIEEASALASTDVTRSAATWPGSWYLRHRSIGNVHRDQALRKEEGVDTAEHIDNDDGTDWMPDLFD